MCSRRASPEQESLHAVLRLLSPVIELRDLEVGVRTIEPVGELVSEAVDGEDEAELAEVGPDFVQIPT